MLPWTSQISRTVSCLFTVYVVATAGWGVKNQDPAPGFLSSGGGDLFQCFVDHAARGPTDPWFVPVLLVSLNCDENTTKDSKHRSVFGTIHLILLMPVNILSVAICKRRMMCRQSILLCCSTHFV